MSALIVYGSSNANSIKPVIRLGHCQNNDALQFPDYRQSSPEMSGWANQLRDTDVTWTRSSLLGSSGQDGVTTGSGGIIQADCQRWEFNYPPTGCHVRKVVSGTVVDINGNPVSGATVQLFNTAAGLLVDTQTSKSDGTYQAGDPNAVSCFAVGYLPGSPDTEGTTVNTLTGS